MNIPYLKEKLFNKSGTYEDIQEILNTFNIEPFRKVNFMAKNIIKKGELLDKFARFYDHKEKMKQIGIIVILLILLSKLYISLFDFVNLTFHLGLVFLVHNLCWHFQIYEVNQSSP